MLQTLAGRIETDIEAQILSGDWPPGTRIPYEHQLMAQYGCSRMTVSKVLGGMAARGLIVRRRRAGSFVAAPGADRAVMEIEDFAELGRRTGQPYRHVMVSSEARRATAAEWAELGTGRPGRVRALSCLHELGGRPIAWEERLIMLDTVPDAAQPSFVDTPPGTWLLRHVPWTEAEHVISAVNADAVLAGRLRVPVGEACLLLHRRTWLQGATVTDVRLSHPASRYRFSGRFSPGATPRTPCTGSVEP